MLAIVAAAVAANLLAAPAAVAVAVPADAKPPSSAIA